MKKGLAGFVSLFLFGCASHAPSVAIPDKLRGGPNETLAMVVPAKGVQIYECRPRRAKIGRHYAGPHWEASDGSKVLGTVRERADAPAAGAIPWLLLSAKSVGPQ